MGKTLASLSFSSSSSRLSRLLTTVKNAKTKIATLHIFSLVMWSRQNLNEEWSSWSRSHLLYWIKKGKNCTSIFSWNQMRSLLRKLRGGKYYKHFLTHVPSDSRGFSPQSSFRFWLDHITKLKMWRVRIALCLFIFSTSLASEEKVKVTQQRDKRLFSLFTVVTFPNEWVHILKQLENLYYFDYFSQCTGQSSTSSLPVYGTCFSASECSTKGGTADGNCAAGFGVCCNFA